MKTQEATCGLTEVTGVWVSCEWFRSARRVSVSSSNESDEGSETEMGMFLSIS